MSYVIGDLRERAVGRRSRPIVRRVQLGVLCVSVAVGDRCAISAAVASDAGIKCWFSARVSAVFAFSAVPSDRDLFQLPSRITRQFASSVTGAPIDAMV